MRKLAYAFLIMTIMVGGLLFLEEGHATSGTLTSNTTWTRVNSPYTLTGNVIINSGVTLTIEPGVTVDFGAYQIQVSGTLNARGTSDSKVILSSNGYSSQKIEFMPTSTAWNEQTGSGCIIENAVIYSVSIVIDGGAPKISNNYFTSNPTVPITVNSGSPLILNNVVNFHSTNGIHINSGSAVISYNSIKGEGQNYGIYNAGTATISNNNITNCWSGIYAMGTSNIQQNNIMNNGNDGIVSNNPASTIQNNVVANNYCGISGAGYILNNTVANNWAGIYSPTPSTAITNNNIFDNTQNIHLTDSSNVQAANNWWGTADTSTINQTIWDFKNATNLGIVNFVPFLNEPNPTAPSIPTLIPTPTPPPTPTPTTTPTPTPTPIPTSTPPEEPSPTPTPDLTQYPTPTPTQTPIEPIESPYSPILGQLDNTDLANVVVIIIAIVTAIIIIVFINKRFGKKQ